jgi:hypothetical protein
VKSWKDAINYVSCGNAPYAAFPDQLQLATILFIVDGIAMGTEYRNDKEEESKCMKTITTREEKI